jgi:hypothetical protein
MLIKSASRSWRSGASPTGCNPGFRFILAAGMLASAARFLACQSPSIRPSCLFRTRVLAGARPRRGRASHRSAMLLHLARNISRHLCVRVLRGFAFAFLSDVVLDLVANLRVFHAFPAMVDFVGAKTVDDLRRMLRILLIRDAR